MIWRADALLIFFRWRCRVTTWLIRHCRFRCRRFFATDAILPAYAACCCYAASLLFSPRRLRVTDVDADAMPIFFFFFFAFAYAECCSRYSAMLVTYAACRLIRHAAAADAADILLLFMRRRVVYSDYSRR